MYRDFQNCKFPTLADASSVSQLLMPIIMGFLIVAIVFGFFFVKIRAAIRKLREEESNANDVEVRVHVMLFQSCHSRESFAGCSP